MESYPYGGCNCVVGRWSVPSLGYGCVCMSVYRCVLEVVMGAVEGVEKEKRKKEKGGRR